MNKKRFLNIKGALLDEKQLEIYLEKIASEHNLQKKSNKDTYPIYRLDDNFNYITKTYELLNSNLKEKINIHPAGEWLLDNYYVIDETYKTIKKELTLKKYINYIGIANGIYKGFARIYVLASEIVACTEGKIDTNSIKNLLKAYQTKKTLNMEEIWSISLFLDIALIEKIRNVCENIYCSQLQKYKVESMIERLVENISENKQFFKNNIKDANIEEYSSKETFIEYLSYRLRLYGKKGLPYLKILEEQVAKIGTTVPEVIKKEHFDIALNKVYIGNCITSIKDIQRLNFIEIFEEINGVENILKQDPIDVYEKMDHTTKNYYRNEIKKLAQKTKISEIYITKKALELAQKENEKIDEYQNEEQRKLAYKKSHIGYYLISNGREKLESILGIKAKRVFNKKNTYIGITIMLTSLFSFIFSYMIYSKSKSLLYGIISLLLIYIPISEIIIKIEHYILSKIVKPKIIPKLYFQKEIPEQYSTMVVIPTILNSEKRVKEMFENLEVFYLANQSENLYFTLLGDCTSSSKEQEEFDEAIIKCGKEQIDILNKKYSTGNYPKFQFIYRKRVWNPKEGSYLGWERKRGLLKEFNEFLLKNSKDNTFLFNSFEEDKIPYIKYIITLDSDTKLVLNSAKMLIGAMAHVLNTPVLDDNKNIVIDGYGIIQPRINIGIEETNKSLFTKIFAGQGGIDFYSNAISDIYQDNFNEGIFTGKGIYDLEVFNKVLKDEIPENTVLSHDLLEGLYLKCGLATDIFLIDGYPTNYNSYIMRQCRWIRGDWQIIRWLSKKIISRTGTKKENPLGELDKYKILDNLRRSLLEIAQVLALIFILLIGINKQISLKGFILIVFVSIFIDLIIKILNYIVYKKEGVTKQESFSKQFGEIKGLFIKSLFNFAVLPYRAYCSAKSIIKTLYRIIKTKNHLLEWTTADEAEKKAQNTLKGYLKQMWINEVISISILLLAIYQNSICILVTAIFWLLGPFVAYKISRPVKKKDKKSELSKKDINYLIEVAKHTWSFFEDYLIEEYNYLPPDNYQEGRAQKIVSNTSSTNIGLGLVSIISAYDLGFINLEKTLDLLEKMIITINKLPKWNGHLYNWYNIKTLTPLKPMYISTVDSGNFVGYVYVVKTFLKDILNYQNEKNKEKVNYQIDYLENLIKQTDFKKLYEKEIGLMSIGFNIEDNKNTPSYYDLLASEARQASFIAIAKKDVPIKHWENLSRTLTLLDRKKGLISWSGTAFEYLMPNIIMKRYEGSLLDESCKFMIMSQKKYCEKLGIPWGISESAFNLKDLNANYQYKAFGIPWLGLKRGLADEAVVSSYGSIMALSDTPEDVLRNIKILEKKGMYKKYGFYEAIDFTPERLSNGKKYEVVKTYLAHHQALILISINNFINNNIMQERFLENPEIKAVDILLQEKMPEKMIITKDKKEIVQKIKYQSYDYYLTREINKINEQLPYINVIANDNYTIVFNQDGTGFSKYKNFLINRYKNTDEIKQGILFYFKNMNNKKIWQANIKKEEYQDDNYKIEFTPDMNKITKKQDNIQTIVKTIITNENVEIRNVKLKNLGNKEELIEVSGVFEPVLSTDIQDYSHKAFNNLFLKYERVREGLFIKRNKRGNTDSASMAVGFFAKDNAIGDMEYEIDKEKLYGRLNKDIPTKIKNSEKFTNQIGLVTDPVVAMKQTIKIKPLEETELNFVISVGEDKLEIVNKLNKYKNFENVEKAFKISKVRAEEEARYLRIKGKDISNYQKILAYLFNVNPQKREYLKKLKLKTYSQEDLWKYGISGDYPILLVKVKEENDIYTVKEILKAYEYFITKNIWIDLIILNEENNVYEKYVQNGIEREIEAIGLFYLINNKIHIIDKNKIENEELFLFTANLIIDGSLGSLKNNLDEIEEYVQNGAYTKTKAIFEHENSFEKFDLEDLNLKYFNEYGGFSNDGREYVISVDNSVPSVWSQILTNGKLGSIITQNLGGYTWNLNSRLNRITRWSNDTILDTPSESIFIQDCAEHKYWRIGENNLLVTYGFGYANYKQNTKNVYAELDVFISINEQSKINILKLKNKENKSRKLNLIYKIRPVLGEDEISSNGYINLEFNKDTNIIKMKNLYSKNENKVCLYSSELIKSFTGNNDYMNLANNETLNNENALGINSCVAIQVEITLEPFEEKEVSFVMEIEENQNEKSFANILNCKEELKNTKKYWLEMLEKIRVKTPIDSFNIMINGWILYQTIACRLLGRSGFYQSGGAFGFRDQLQDCIGIEYVNPSIVKQQILKHAAHQFIEGDVEHWWHDENKRGIRTKFSDDRLWLVYLTLDYINFTNDKEILNEKIPYIKGKILNEDEDENYDLHETIDIKEDLYSHCKRAINISLKFGKNGLPLIGSGDWNDGLNTVGNKGKGESVWLGFFLYDILNRFIEIANEKQDVDSVNQYKHIIEKLKKALNTNGWDGHWYKRAFTDNGETLGSFENSECRIDSIAQSWSVISNAGENDKKYIAMENLERYLIDKETGIIKLLDPPFENSNIEPGYIKSYLPGVRENGGQYTHAAIWAIMALAKLGLKEKAVEYYTMINPIEHSKTKEKEEIYKIEPYVIPADIYGSKNLLRKGRLELVYRFF